jgi:uncharacterized membrane protein
MLFIMDRLNFAKTEWAILGLGLGALFAHILKVLLSLTSLPATIPLRFGFSGDPTSYGPNTTIWILPILGVVIHLLFWIISSRPALFNLPWNPAPEFKQILLRKCMRFILTMNIAIQLTFYIATSAIINISLGNEAKLSIWFLPLFLVALTGLIMRFYMSARKLSNRHTGI